MKKNELKQLIKEVLFESELKKDNDFMKVWQSLAAFQEKGIEAWDDNGTILPDFVKRLRDLKIYINRLKL